MLGPTLSVVLVVVMVLLCFCLTDVWSIAGSLESHFTPEFLVDNLGSARGSSSLELYRQRKVSLSVSGPVGNLCYAEEGKTSQMQ